VKKSTVKAAWRNSVPPHCQIRWRICQLWMNDALAARQPVPDHYEELQLYADPLKPVFFRMTKRAEGSEVVNEGNETPELARACGLPEDSDATLRWTFSEIIPKSFH
jgi:hypothetical protein